MAAIGRENGATAAAAGRDAAGSVDKAAGEARRRLRTAPAEEERRAAAAIAGRGAVCSGRERAQRDGDRRWNRDEGEISWRLLDWTGCFDVLDFVKSP